MKTMRIIVVGGSIGGLFAVILLHRAGFDVTVLERSTHGLEGTPFVGQSHRIDTDVEPPSRRSSMMAIYDARATRCAASLVCDCRRCISERRS